MKDVLRSPISHMLQGLAHWMAYRSEMSSVQIIESDAVFAATDMLKALLPAGFVVEKEVTSKNLPLLNEKQRIDLGIRCNGTYECLIEFKLSDATNKGYTGDVKKLSVIKQSDASIDCLVVILYRKSYDFNKPEAFVNANGGAKRAVIKVKNNDVKVRRVCNSFTSKKNDKSKKTICIEVL